MAVIGAGVSLRGLHQEDFMYTFLISGSVVAADVGKAVTLDTSVANTMKLAGDGDPIYDRLETFENRIQEGIKVGAVSTKGGLKFPTGDGETVNVGDEIQGDGAGAVKAVVPYVDTDGSGDPVVNATTHQKMNYVVEVGSGFVIAVLR